MSISRVPCFDLRFMRCDYCGPCMLILAEILSFGDGYSDFEVRIAEWIFKCICMLVTGSVMNF